MTALDLTATAPATPRLFQPGAVERVVSPERLDVAAPVVRPASWLLLLVCAVAAVAAVAAAILIRIPIKVQAEGLLISAAGVKEVSATSGGQIKSLLVKVGDRVEVGRAIAQLEQPDLRQELESAGAELKDARDQLDKVLAVQSRTQVSQEAYRVQQRKNLESSIAFLEQRVTALGERMRDFEDLAARGVVTKQKLLDGRLELANAKEELARSRASLKQLDVEQDVQGSDRERERLGLELKVAAAERKVAMLSERMSRVDTVTSTYAGRIAEIKVNEGELVERGGALVTVLPDETGAESERAPLIAVLYVPAASGKKVQVGMPAEIVPATVKREEHGFIRARVTAVSDVPVTQEGMVRVLKNRQLAQTLAANGSPFEVRAEMERSAATVSGLAWSSSTGPDQVLSGGSPCRGEVVVKDEPILQLLIPATRPFFEFIGR